MISITRFIPNAPDHPLKGSEILKEKGVSEEIRRAILGHANYTGVPRDTLLAKVLFACDEVAGFITACSLVRPDRIASLEAKSVRKRMKDKAFARSVSREDITKGAEELGVPLDEHITFCIAAMREIADQLGLVPPARLPREFGRPYKHPALHPPPRAYNVTC